MAGQKRKRVFALDDPAIHGFCPKEKEEVDHRAKPGDDV
jgi:hypothetical protein